MVSPLQPDGILDGLVVPPRAKSNGGKYPQRIGAAGIKLDRPLGSLLRLRSLSLSQQRRANFAWAAASSGLVFASAEASLIDAEGPGQSPIGGPPFWSRRGNPCRTALRSCRNLTEYLSLRHAASKRIEHLRNRRITVRSYYELHDPFHLRVASDLSPPRFGG